MASAMVIDILFSPFWTHVVHRSIIIDLILTALDPCMTSTSSPVMKIHICIFFYIHIFEMIPSIIKSQAGWQDPLKGAKSEILLALAAANSMELLSLPILFIYKGRVQKKLIEFFIKGWMVGSGGCQILSKKIKKTCLSNPF